MVALCVSACSSSGDRDDTSTSVTNVTSATVPMTMTDPTTGGTTDVPGTTTGAPDTTTTGTSDPGLTSTTADPPTTTGTPGFDVGTAMDLPPGPPKMPQLWYSVEDLLVYIPLNPADGTAMAPVVSTMDQNPTLGGGVNSCSLTMLPDGSLLGGRGIAPTGTRLFHVPNPPTVAGPVDVDILGVIPNGTYLEALHTACDGRVFMMDTGSDNVSNAGNRLLAFTGDFLAGQFGFEVITDLSSAVSVDIDDMAPGIDAGGLVIDNPGYGIDSAMVYALDYTTGTGNLLGEAGTYGIHALGGDLFDDGVSRLYVLDIDANLYEADPTTLALSPVLTTGPTLASGNAPGNTGLAGPLTDCRTGFPPPG
jgi:hypothetical protein